MLVGLVLVNKCSTRAKKYAKRRVMANKDSTKHFVKKLTVGRTRSWSPPPRAVFFFKDKKNICTTTAKTPQLYGGL